MFQELFRCLNQKDPCLPAADSGGGVKTINLITNSVIYWVRNSRGWKVGLGWAGLGFGGKVSVVTQVRLDLVEVL